MSPSTVPLPSVTTFLKVTKKWLLFVLFGPRNAYGKTTVTHDQKRDNDVKKSA